LAHGAYFGAYIQPPSYGQPQQIAAIHQMQNALGRRLAIVHSYLRWHRPFPTPSQQVIMRQRSLLLLSWAGTNTRAIAAGAYDGWVSRQALAIKATHRPILLEWRWEMNRPGLTSQVHSPADYIAAWDRIHKIFASLHVHNVAWVWCPSIVGFGLPGYRPATDYYPGNREVDWLCVDAYPRLGPRLSFAALLGPFLRWAAHIAKPVMIGEFGVPRAYGPRMRARWLRGAARTVRQDPQVEAVVYFDGDPPNYPLFQYGLDRGTPPFRAFRSIAAMPYFRPRAPSKFRR
jgi:hypothetical protein